MAPPRVLFIRLGAIGDVVRTLPALRLVRHRLPEAHVSWVVEERSYRVLAGHPEIDEVDVNPLFVGRDGAVAADALVVIRQSDEGRVPEGSGR